MTAAGARNRLSSYSTKWYSGWHIGWRGTSIRCVSHPPSQQGRCDGNRNIVSERRGGGMAMKVRFGFTCRGQTDLALDHFPQLVDDLERLGFDSLWLPELMLNGPS